MHTRFESLVAAVTALAMLSACGGEGEPASPEAPPAALCQIKVCGASAMSQC